MCRGLRNSSRTHPGPASRGTATRPTAPNTTTKTTPTPQYAAPLRLGTAVNFADLGSVSFADERRHRLGSIFEPDARLGSLHGAEGL